jgi:serine/threonine protein kinase
MKKWLYKNKEIECIEDLGENTFGFIYVTTHIPTGKKYLGKKSLYSTINKKLGKKELANQPITRGRSKTTKQITKESDWKTYYGSEEFIKDKIKNNLHSEFSREIIQLVPTKKLLTYFECKYQFIYNVLESEEWINLSILGKFYKKDFDI